MQETIELLKEWLKTQPKCEYCNSPAVQYQENGDWSGTGKHYFCNNRDHALVKGTGFMCVDWIGPITDYHNRVLVEKTIEHIKKLEEETK